MKKIFTLFAGLFLIMILSINIVVAQECPEGYVPGDTDGDGIPDVCDPDSDGDGVADHEDQLPGFDDTDPDNYWWPGPYNFPF